MVKFRTEDQSALHCVAEQSSWSCFCSQGTGISNAFAAVLYGFYSLLKKGLFYTIMPSLCVFVKIPNINNMKKSFLVARH